jgi:hypothetical protein
MWKVEMNKIKVDAKYMPVDWDKELMANQRVGGLLLVFLSGKDKTELKDKVKKIRRFCKII